MHSRHSSQLARTVVGGVLVSTIALIIAACGDDDATIPPPGAQDSGASSSGDTGASSGDPDGSSSGDASDAGQDTGTTTPVVSADCATFADAYCDLFLRCYPILLGSLDLATCKARAGLGCTLSTQAPGAAQVPTTCSAAIKAATCASNVSNVDPSCQIKGTIANDAVCEYDGQCQSGSCSKKGATGPCATCKPRSLVNTSCQTTDCDYGLQCAEGTCVAPVALNNACSKGQCQPPNRCVGGTCKVPLAQDAICISALPGGDDPCEAVKGDYCKPGAAGPSMCKPILFADPGAACGVVNGGLVGCKGTASCKAQKCVAHAADGAACNTTSGPDCTGPAECINGACTFPKADRCK